MEAWKGWGKGIRELNRACEAEGIAFLPLWSFSVQDSELKLELERDITIMIMMGITSTWRSWLLSKRYRDPSLDQE